MTGDLLEVKARMLKYQELASNCWEYITNNCKCEQEHLVTTELYSDGGYDYTASTEYYETCSICNKQHHKSTIKHSWYG